MRPPRPRYFIETADPNLGAPPEPPVPVRTGPGLGRRLWRQVKRVACFLVHFPRLYCYVGHRPNGSMEFWCLRCLEFRKLA